MSDISVRPGYPLPVLTPIIASAIPIGRPDTLERNVAAILGLDYEAFLKAPPAVAIPSAPAASAEHGRRRIPIVAGAACVVAAGIAFALNAPVRAPSPPPARIAVTGPLPSVAPVPPRPVQAPIAPAAVADATPVAHLVVHKEERAPARRQHSLLAPPTTVGQAFAATAPPEGSVDMAAPADPDAPVTRLADRDGRGTGTPPIANAAPSATPVLSDTPPEEEAKARPAKARTEAIEAIRMLRRQ